MARKKNKGAEIVGRVLGNLILGTLIAQAAIHTTGLLHWCLIAYLVFLAVVYVATATVAAMKDEPETTPEGHERVRVLIDGHELREGYLRGARDADEFRENLRRAGHK